MDEVVALRLRPASLIATEVLGAPKGKLPSSARPEGQVSVDTVARHLGLLNLSVPISLYERTKQADQAVNQYVFTLAVASHKSKCYASLLGFVGGASEC